MHFCFMRKFYQLLLLVGGVVTTVSCSSLHSIKENAPTVTASDRTSSYDSLPYRAIPTKSWELIHTKIDIAFSLSEKTAEATTVLTMHPYCYSMDSVSLDAKSMKLISVDANQKPLSYQYNGQKLNIRFSKYFNPKDTLQLTIHYIAMPYAQQNTGGKAITEDRGLYFINTDHFEPFQQIQIWTQGETEANSHWFPTFDHSNYRSSFEITMHVPDSFKTLSNGKLVQSVAEKNGMRADTWIQEKPIPPYLAMMAASNFAVAQDASWKGKTVAYYVPQEYKAYAKDIFRNTPEMIDFFSKKLKMDFPWQKYSQVIGYDYVSGAMENVSASLFGAFNLKDTRQIADDNNDFIVAHELFHQWFGDYVTCENWSQITLNESFADLSEKLWAEYKYGQDEAEIEFYHSKLRYLGQTPTSDLPLVRFRYKDPDDVFDRVSYSKGGMILNYLRKLTGDTAFYAALHLYLTQNALQSTEADQLRLAFEKVTGKDWHWFFNQWYQKGGHPILDVHCQYNDSAREMTVKVQQMQHAADYQTSVYRLPLKAQIIRGNRLETIDWLVDSQSNVFVFPYNGDQRPIFIADAGHWLPGEIQGHKDFQQWKSQYFAGLHAIETSKSSDATETEAKKFGFPILNHLDVMSRHNALYGIFNAKGKVGSARIDSVLKVVLKKDNSDFIRLTAMNLLIAMNVPINEEWKAFYYDVAQRDKSNQVRAAAIFWLAGQKDSQYSNFFEKETNAYSYYVAGAALFALNELNHHRAEIIARQLLEKNKYSATWLSVAGSVIAQDGHPEDYSFFSNILWHKFEGDRATFMSSFTKYLLNVTNDSTFHQGLELIQKLADKEGAGSRFQIQMYSPVFYLYGSLERKLGAASGKNQKERLQRRRNAALNLWKHYVGSVTNENTLTSIKAIEGMKRQG